MKHEAHEAHAAIGTREESELRAAGVDCDSDGRTVPRATVGTAPV